MAKKGGGGGDDWWRLVGLGAFVGLAWLIGGRGQSNSPYVPDPLENQIDLAVDGLNKKFGHQWVTEGLNVLQAYLERTQPQVAWLVRVLHAVEGQSAGWPPMTKQARSQAKKQAAVQMVHGQRA